MPALAIPRHQEHLAVFIKPEQLDSISGWRDRREGSHDGFGRLVFNQRPGPDKPIPLERVDVPVG